MKKLLLSLSVFLLISRGTALADSIIDPVLKIIPTNDDSMFNYPVTGLFLNDEGYILTTADNVMYGGDVYSYLNIYVCPVKIEEKLSPNCSAKAEIISILPSLNLALLKLKDENNKFIYDFETPKFIDYTPQDTEELTVKGFGYERYEFTGEMRSLNDDSLIPMRESRLGEEKGNVIIQKSLEEGVNWYYLTNTFMNLGNSGGPVYNDNGDLIGLTSAYGNGDDNNYYLIPPKTGNSVGYVISSDTIIFFFLATREAGLIDQALIDNLFSAEHLEKIKMADPKVDIYIMEDVDLLSPYYQSISYLKENSIISGYPDGSFKPENPLNRAELLKILAEAGGHNPKTENYKNCFPEVKNEWFARYVCFAYEKNWINGYPDGTFKPGNYVNKAEAIKMLMNAFELYQHRNESTGGFDGYPYLDVSVGAWFFQYIGQAKEFGILEEMEGYFYPGNFISRGQISENIYRLLILLKSTE